jgi:hypothetical protein
MEYRYFKQVGNRRKFDRTKSGAHKYWELERCLNDSACPIDKDTANNLRFLVGLRHEIEHQMTMRLDDYLSGRYQACALNYNRHIKQLFGDSWGIDKYLTYSLQFIEMSYEQVSTKPSAGQIPSRIENFILEFDRTLTENEYNNPAYSFRLFFSKKLVNQPGQADRVVEFIDPNSELAKTIDKEYWVKKEVEKPKYLPKDVVRHMKDKGFARFSVHHHTQLWKQLDAKKSGKGFGILVANTWYWYETWLKAVEEHCEANRGIYTAS